MALVLRPRDVVRRPDPGVQHHAFQFSKVRCRQRLVQPQLVNGDVVLVRLEELPRLRQELRAVGHVRNSGSVNGGLGAHLVLEVGVDRLALDLLDQLDEQPQPLPRRLQHRHGHVLPPFLTGHRVDQRHLLAHHRNAALVFQHPDDGPHLLLQPLEARLDVQHRQLQVQHQQVEPLGFFVVVRQFRRQ